MLCLYAAQAEAFDDEEMSLLEEMAMDLGFGIETLRLRNKEAAAQDALQRTNEELETRVTARTAALAQANRELEAFSYSASHDLRAPLRSMAGFAEILHEDYGDRLDDAGRSHLQRIRKAAIRMGQLIDDLLQLARVSRADLSKASVNLSGLAQEVLDELASDSPGRSVKVSIQENLMAEADPILLRVALQNLMENAWKYSGQRPDAEIDFGARPMPDGKLAYYVRDNGSGFDMAHAARLFQPFVRLHSGEDYPGTGIGLATVARVIERHGGRVWAEAEKDQGATFFFTLDVRRRQLALDNKRDGAGYDSRSNQITPFCHARHYGTGAAAHGTAPHRHPDRRGFAGRPRPAAAGPAPGRLRAGLPLRAHRRGNGAGAV